MIALRFVGVSLVGLLIAATTAVAPATGASASRTAAVELSMSPPRVSARLGDDFHLTSTITNEGRTRLSGLVAHLNVVSWSNGVYVDPEDWSSERTRYLPPLRPAHSVAIGWTVTPVNGGHFAIYVVVLPARRPGTPRQRLAVGPDVDVRVAERRTLDSRGVLALALGVPASLGLAVLGVGIRRRR